MTDRKPRDRIVQLAFGEPARADGVRVFLDGHVELLHGDERLTPEHAHVEITYDRPHKKPKVISRVPVAGPRLPTHPHDALVGADRFFFVDTNWRQIGEQRVHAWAVIVGVPRWAPFRTILEFEVGATSLHVPTPTPRIMPSVVR